MDKLEQWQASGGTLRLIELSEQQAIVDLCTCTGEMMERWSTDDPAIVRRLHATLPAEEHGSGGQAQPR